MGFRDAVGTFLHDQRDRSAGADILLFGGGGGDLGAGENVETEKFSLTVFKNNGIDTGMNLNELIASANHYLAGLGLDRMGDGRVADSLTPRNVRFLRQAGVISRPEGQGSAARWGGIHLRQLVTARILQANGMSISEARDRIAGLDADALSQLEKESVAVWREPSGPELPDPCSAWQVTPDFILVSTRRASLSPAKLALIRRILTSRA